MIPPNTQLVISGAELHLGPRPDDRSQYTPVDAFFSSLAQSAGQRCVGVILSGTASDGAAGVSEIKAAGGVTIAQSPESAKYDGMPRAAIATGMIDVVLPPEEIGQEARPACTLYKRTATPARPVRTGDGGGAASPGIRSPAPGERRRFPPLQAADDQATVVPAHGACTGCPISTTTSACCGTMAAR